MEFVCPLCQRLLPMAGRNGVIAHYLRDHSKEPLARAIGSTLISTRQSDENMAQSEENSEQQTPPGRVGPDLRCRIDDCRPSQYS